MVGAEARTRVDVRLIKEEYQALVTFNKEVMFHARGPRDIGYARQAAAHDLHDHDIQYLASAFRTLYPHWFTNGRGTLAEGTSRDCRKVVLDVLEKLNPNAGRFDAMRLLFDLSGNHAMATGRRPLAHSDRNDNSLKRTRTRVRQANCKYHPNKPTGQGELCFQCYQRQRGLRLKGIHLDHYSEVVVREILQHPRTSRRYTVLTMAREIITKYKKLEGVDANSTA